MYTLNSTYELNKNAANFYLGEVKTLLKSDNFKTRQESETEVVFTVSSVISHRFIFDKVENSFYIELDSGRVKVYSDCLAKDFTRLDIINNINYLTYIL